MPNIKQTEKRLRQDKKKNALNRVVRTRIKNTVKAVRNIEKGEDPAEKLSTVYSVLDTAAKKGILKKNKVARLKSRLTKSVAVKSS